MTAPSIVKVKALPATPAPNTIYLIPKNPVADGQFQSYKPGETDIVMSDTLGNTARQVGNNLPVYTTGAANPNSKIVNFGFAVWYGGTPSANQILASMVAPFDFTLAGNLAGCKVRAASVAPTSQAVFNIKVNGTIKGTITYSAGQATPALASVSGAAITVQEGQLFEVVAPGVADATLEGVGVTFAGTRAFIIQ